MSDAGIGAVLPQPAAAPQVDPAFIRDGQKWFFDSSNRPDYSFQSMLAAGVLGPDSHLPPEDHPDHPNQQQQQPSTRPLAAGMGPQSLGSRILGALNPISTAQAAETPSPGTRDILRDRDIEEDPGRSVGTVIPPAAPATPQRDLPEGLRQYALPPPGAWGAPAQPQPPAQAPAQPATPPPPGTAQQGGRTVWSPTEGLHPERPGEAGGYTLDPTRGLVPAHPAAEVTEDPSRTVGPPTVIPPAGPGTQPQPSPPGQQPGAPGQMPFRQMMEPGAPGPGGAPGAPPTGAPAAIGPNRLLGAAGQQAAATLQGTNPDRFMRWLVSAGPLGLPMTQRWQSAEHYLSIGAAANGHYNLIPQIHAYFAQMSHQGVMAYLFRADQALAEGDTNSAVMALANAHAFFPDNSYARFGVDKTGQIWGQQFDEHSGIPMGNAIPISRVAIQTQMMQFGDPATYIQRLQEYQHRNAQTQAEIARAGYWEAGGGRAGATGQLTEAQAQKEANAKQNAVDRAVEQEYAGPNAQEGYRKPDNPGPDATPQQQETYRNQMTEWSTVAGMDRALRSPYDNGGANMSGPEAHELASDFRNLQFHPTTRKSDGKPGVAVIDEKGQTRAFLSDEAARQLQRLPGIRGMVAGPGAQGAEGAPGAEGAAGPIGAGARSPAALMMGVGNLAGQGQQQQPAPLGETSPDAVREQQQAQRQRAALGLP